MTKKSTISEDGLLFLYLKAISKHHPLSAKEESALAVRIRKGDKEAFGKLVKANLRFVVNVAKNYQNQGLPLVDLINEGNLGLLRAVSRFDESKNFKFITYAVWWIRQAILKALAELSRVVKLPLNRVGILYKIGRAQIKLEQLLNHQPNVSEIAQELKLEEKEVLQTLQIGNAPLSLNAPLNDDSGSSLLDCMPDETVEESDRKIMDISLKAEIDKILDDLDKREREVIRLYFGLGSEKPHTLQEIGEHFRLSRERARQIKQRALKRLRNSPRRGRLSVYK